MKTLKSIMVCAMAAVAMMAGAQNNFRSDDNFKFNHLSLGGSIGTTGIGIEAAMPANRHFGLRAGIDMLALGRFNVKVANSLGNIYSFLGVNDKDIDETARNEKVELGITATMFTGHLLVDYYPWKDSAFHITAGVYMGNSGALHAYNTKDGSAKFLNVANHNVQVYNDLFGTNYPEIGLQFGDYVFTADEKGNVDAVMHVSVVRPYLGFGFGRTINVEKKRKVNVNFDFGCQYWGKPSFKMNGEKKVKSNDKNEGGVFQSLSGFDVWPTLKITLCGEIF